jgi:hypothetical protein
MYQRDGRMSVNIMRSDLPRFASNNLMEATSEEIKSGFEGILATVARMTSMYRKDLLFITSS